MKFARWIASWAVAPEWRDSMLGDLHEERQRRLQAGKSAGASWAAVAVLAAALALRRERRSRSRSGRAVTMTDGLWMDGRQAVRSLRAAPGFTAIAVLVLTLGIGATTAIFSVVDATLLRPLPFDAGDRLVTLGENDAERPASVPGYVSTAAGQTFREWEKQQTVMAALAASQTVGGFTVRDGGQPANLQAMRATASFFEVLRIQPQRGQWFTAHHETAGRDRVLVIGDRLWRTRFNADPDIIGKTMTFDSGVWEIIGVLPPDFRFPLQLAQTNDVIAPFVRSSRDLIWDRTKTGRNYSLRVIGRLRDGVSLEQARAQMQAITDGLAVQHPDWYGDRKFAMESLHTSVVGRARAWMLMMLGVVAFVLLIACANVANLMLARAAARSRELVVRAALGASRWRLIRGLLVESLVLSMAGLAGALLLAWWGVRILKTSMPTSIPKLAELGLDFRVLGAAAIAAIVTGLVCGLVPALQWSGANAQRGLRDGGRSVAGGGSRQRLRAGLVVAEVSLAVVLLVGAGLFVASFWRVIGVDLGLNYQSVVTGSINPRILTVDAQGFNKARDATAPLLETVQRRLRNTPGVEVVAAIAGGSPMSGSFKTNSITVPGKGEFKNDADQVQIREVSPDYRAVIGVPLKRGRYIEASDTATSPRVVVVNEELVRRFFDGADPIGAIVKLNDADRLIVGVVGDVRVRGPEVPVSPEAYFPIAQEPGIGGTVIARVAGDPAAFLPTMRAAILEALPDVPPVVTTLEESLRGITSQRRFNMLLVGLFGVLAVVIAAVGIYGVMAYTVAQQTREIGVRMALGARPQRVLAAVLQRAAIYMAAGVSIGLFGAYLMAGTVESFLFGVRPHDPFVFASVGVVLVASGLVAAIVPALRAARVDPIIALRAE